MTSSTRIARIAALIVAVAPLTACTSAYGRYNPTVTVDVRKAPRVGFLVEEVVFAPPELSPPPGADERADVAVLSGLGQDVTVPDVLACRAELVLALMRGLPQSGIRVATYGSHEGADAMIEIDVTDCTARPVALTIFPSVDECRVRSRLDFRATYRIIDLSNNSEATSDDLNSAHATVKTSRCRAHRIDRTMLEQAYSAAVQSIVPLFLETVEERSLVFFDEDKCGMKVAHGAVAAGDYERALELSLANAEHCRIGPEAKVESKDMAAANYNVGILYRIMGISNRPRNIWRGPARSTLGTT